LKPLVSIIITAYNQEDFISEAIESVLNQTYTNLECIIIDDGSIDKTRSICEKYLQQDKRLKYFFQENKGVSLARNKGFKLSSGTFIHFLDGDDFILEDKIEKQVEFLETNSEYDICYSNYSHLFQNKNIIQPADHVPITKFPLEDFLFRWDRNIGTTIHSALFRRHIWEENEMPFPIDYTSRYEDWVFWVMIALKNKTIAHLEFNGAIYRIHANNLTSETNTNIEYFFQAMFYIHPKIPGAYQKKFVEENVNYLLDKYAKQRIFKDVYHTWTWKLAKLFSWLLNPFNFILKKKLS
jgi:glycosyltransferase involved in cell wall biosynthesis